MASMAGTFHLDQLSQYWFRNECDKRSINWMKLGIKGISHHWTKFGIWDCQWWKQTSLAMAEVWYCVSAHVFLEKLQENSGKTSTLYSAANLIIIFLSMFFSECHSSQQQHPFHRPPWSSYSSRHLDRRWNDRHATVREQWPPPKVNMQHIPELRESKRHGFFNFDA